MASVEERLKLKRGKVDPWSTRERLCLASSVVRSGNQNWMSVSRSLKGFGGEPGRPADWFSQKSCAVQYDNLLTQIETPKRKKRGADGSKAEGVDMTPAEVIVKQLTGERIQELRNMMDETRSVYMKEKEEMYRVQNGLADDKLEEFFMQIQQEKKIKEAEQEEQQKLLKQREERKQEAESGWRSHSAQQQVRGAAARRPSNQSELGSEADNVESPSSSDQLPPSEEVVDSKPASTPTSPLLTSLLESPSPVTGPQSSSILHSAITSQRGASPTITSLLNSSPGVPSSNTLSPNLKSLVSNALAGHDDVPKPQTSRSASSSPTLSMLLGLPPSTPGKLPQLPYSATKEPASTPTSKTGDEKDQPTVEHESEAEDPKSSEQCQSSVESTLEVQGLMSPEYSTIAQKLSNIDDLNSIQTEQVVEPHLVQTFLDVETPKPIENEQSVEHHLGIPLGTEESKVDYSLLEPQQSLPEAMTPKEYQLPPHSKNPPVEIFPVTLDTVVDEPISNLQHIDSLVEFEGLKGQRASPTKTGVENIKASTDQTEREHSAVLEQCQQIVDVSNVEECLKTKSFVCSLSKNVDVQSPPESCQIDDRRPELESENSIEESKSAVTISEMPLYKTPDHTDTDSSISELPMQTQECLSDVQKSEQSLVEVPGTLLKLSQPTLALESAHSESSLKTLQITSPGAPHQGDPSIGTPSAPAQVKGPTADELLETTSPRAVDSMKKEPIPDLNNMDIILPVESESKASDAENKVNLDSADLPDELEYVVDSSIDVVLQEFGPEGLVDEMVYIVSSDVETDIGNMLDAAETNDGTVSEQVESKPQPEINKDSGVASSLEQNQEKEKKGPVSVMALSSPVRQSAQQTVSTPSSVVTSPRSVGRPAKGNMGPRKIVMEEEDLPKTDLVPNERDLQQVAEDSEILSREALDLENASVLFVQDNGELVKLSESGQATNIIDNIQVIQDPSSSSGVVVVPHDDTIKDSEADSNLSSKSVTEESSDENAEEQRESHVSAQKNDQENETPCSNDQKSSEKSDPKHISPSKRIDVYKSDEDVCSDFPDIPTDTTQEVEPSQPEETSSVVEPNEQTDKASEIVSEVKDEVVKCDKPLSPREGQKKQQGLSSPPLSPKEGLKRQKIASPPLSPREVLKKQKVSSPGKRDKSPVSSESSNELIPEEDTMKQDNFVVSKRVDEHDKVESQEVQKETVDVQVEDEETRHADSEVPAAQVKEEKTLRAETPSTEDDNTRDTEPAPPQVKRRGRYARESTTNSDSVPNSPVPSGPSHDDEKEHRAWKKSIMLVYNRIAAHKNASIFFRPITDDKAPGYSSMIFRPFDLQTIKKNIETGVIRTTDEFQRDILLMFYNAIMYNISGSPLYDMAREMQEESVANLNEYRNTQLYVSTVGAEGGHLPSRRGTRTAEKRDQESDGFVTRRGIAEKANATRGVFSSNLLGKRKRSMPDDKITPKRRKDDD
ncbi:Bromodomain-containing protein 8 [Frankliniella fusca]|uniref:Bromodomain-containing protein 8 n=1 Tax=Frankliniella fusca TaxID=407009 RepID=A0AAE1L9U0_9NEOP|nr:Bromodomain-containing protein 8 [Frankliniella fusca]